MKHLLRPACVLFASLTLIVGLLYPLAVTGIGRLAFAGQAAGSLIVRDGAAVGSRLIGQAFTSPRYFWGRPSATGPMPNNGAGSAGSNLGPTNPALIDAVEARLAALRAFDPAGRRPVPVDLVTASASGLDPDISVAAARYQIARVAAARHMAPQALAQLVDAHTIPRWLGLFGEARVNVLQLNLALDAPPAKS